MHIRTAGFLNASPSLSKFKHHDHVRDQRSYSVPLTSATEAGCRSQHPRVSSCIHCFRSRTASKCEKRWGAGNGVRIAWGSKAFVTHWANFERTAAEAGLWRPSTGQLRPMAVSPLDRRNNIVSAPWKPSMNALGVTQKSCAGRFSLWNTNPSNSAWGKLGLNTR